MHAGRRSAAVRPVVVLFQSATVVRSASVACVCQSVCTSTGPSGSWEPRIASRVQGVNFVPGTGNTVGTLGLLLRGLAAGSGSGWKMVWLAGLWGLGLSGVLLLGVLLVNYITAKIPIPILLFSSLVSLVARRSAFFFFTCCFLLLRSPLLLLLFFCLQLPVYDE